MTHDVTLRLPRGRAFGRLRGRWAFVAAGALGVMSLVACDPSADAPPAATQRIADPVGTLVTHAVEPSTPTPQGLAYINAIADVHERAEAASAGPRRIEILRQGLAVPVPAALGEAEILRLDLAATIGEALLEQESGGPLAARTMLVPMLEPARSLPLDRATARALVVLGDAATKSGDDSLAVGSYLRAVRLMRLLREELER